MNYLLLVIMAVTCPVDVVDEVTWDVPSVDVIGVPVCYGLPEFPNMFRRAEDRIENYYMKQNPCGCRHRERPKCDVPEPSTVVVFGIGGVVLIWFHLTRKRG